MAESSLDFLKIELDAVTRQVQTAQQLESTADEKVQQKVDMEASRDATVRASNTLIDTQQQLVNNSSSLAGIAAEIDAAIQSQQSNVQKVSGLEVKTAQVAEQFQAPARQNYQESVGNPAIDANIKRYQSQIDIYSAKMANLQADTSLLGNAKRAFLEGATQRRLDQAQADLAAAQNRKINATNVLNASLKGSELFANSSTAVERAMVTDSLVRSESAIKLLSSKAVVTEADRKVLQDTLMLDSMRVKKFEDEFNYLKDRGLATNASMAALQTKIYSQQIQEQAARKGTDINYREQVKEDFRAFIKDSTSDEGEQSRLMRLFPDPFSPVVTESKIGQVFWQSNGIRGTKNEFAKVAIAKRDSGNMQLNDDEKVALDLIDGSKESTRQAIEIEFANKIKSDRANTEKYEAERKEALKKLADPAVQAEFYAKALAGMEKNAAPGITSGAIIIPDWNKQLTDPTFPYSANISEKFKEIVVSDDWVAINMGMNKGTDPTIQLQGIAQGITEYVGKQIDMGVKGIVFDDKTNEVIKTVAQGVADTYKSVRQMNNQSNAGLGSNVLPAIIIPNVGISGRDMNIENAAEWEQLLRRSLQKRHVDITRAVNNPILPKM